MKLLKLTKQEEAKLQKQFKFGSDLSEQEVVVKVFNPYGRGRWYLINQDPNDPDYIWAIVDLGMGVDVGSVSLSELQGVRMRVYGYGMPLEKDRGFRPTNAMMVYEGISESGRTFADGGEIKIKVASKDIYTKNHYKGIFQDSDKDGVPDIDDAQPKNPKLQGEVEELKFSQVFERLLKTKKSLDKIMRAAIEELERISPAGSTIYARTKTPYSIVNKLINKKSTSLERTKLGDVEGLTDLIGTTVVVKSLDDINDVAKELDKGVLGEILEKKDYYDKPKAGYRAIHYITIFEGVAIEVQLKTYRQKQINEASHEAYKYENLEADRLLFLTNLANEADKGDKKAQVEIEKLLLDPKALKQSLYKDKIRGNKLPS
jgi:ppGpp synthetase/RelA/SpoT-type nucleotidyltranferase